MSAYANDSRVRQSTEPGPPWEREIFLADGAVGFVWAKKNDEWAAAGTGDTRAGFATADEAIHSLIGDPR